MSALVSIVLLLSSAGRDASGDIPSNCLNDYDSQITQALAKLDIPIDTKCKGDIVKVIMGQCKESSFVYTDECLPRFVDSLTIALGKLRWDSNENHPRLADLCFQRNLLDIRSGVSMFERLQGIDIPAEEDLAVNDKAVFSSVHDILSRRFSMLSSEIVTRAVDEARRQWDSDRKNFFSPSGKRAIDEDRILMLTQRLELDAAKCADDLSKNMAESPEDVAADLPEFYLRKALSGIFRQLHLGTTIDIVWDEASVEKVHEIFEESLRLDDEMSEINDAIGLEFIAQKKHESLLRGMDLSDGDAIPARIENDPLLALVYVENPTPATLVAPAIDPVSPSDVLPISPVTTTLAHDNSSGPSRLPTIVIVVSVIVCGLLYLIRRKTRSALGSKLGLLLLFLIISIAWSLGPSDPPVVKYMEDLGIRSTLAGEDLAQWKIFVRDSLQSQTGVPDKHLESLPPNVEATLIQMSAALSRSGKPQDARNSTLSHLVDVAIAVLESPTGSDNQTATQEKMRDDLLSLQSLVSSAGLADADWESGIDACLAEIDAESYLPLFSRLWSDKSAGELRIEFQEWCQGNLQDVMRGRKYFCRVSDCEILDNQELFAHSFGRQLLHIWRLIVSKSVRSQRTERLQGAVGTSIDERRAFISQ